MRTAALSLALLLAACKPPAAPTDDAPVTVRVLAINDFHGALYEERLRDDPDTAVGGLPWLTAAVQAERTEHPDLLLLDGGDLFQGSWPVNQTRGRGSVEALELVGIDAAAIGNHEFDYGGLEGHHPRRGALEVAAADAEFAWLSANILGPDGAPWRPEGVAAWTTLQTKGKQIAVVGLTTADTPQVTLYENVKDLTFVDVVDSVRELLPEIEATDPDATILLGHLTGSCRTDAYLEPGEPCTPDGEIGRLLTELPEGTFDVMILGHAHTMMAHRIDDTFLLENRAYGHAIGRVDLAFDGDGVDPDLSTLHDPWPLTHAPADPGCAPGEYDLSPQQVGGRTLTPSAEALALVRSLEAEAGSLCSEVGCVARHLGRSRGRESEVGNLVADAIAWAMPEADIAIQNSGGLRADLEQGTLRREDLQAVMPFDNRLLLIEMSGAQVLRLLRIGSSGAHGIMQVAGARYHFDDTVTTGDDIDGDGAIEQWEHDRLCSAALPDGRPIDPEATYAVATTDFLYAGGDHLAPAFEGATVLEEGPLLREALFDYPSSLDTCLGAAGPLIDPDQPRIVVAPCEATSGGAPE